MNLILIVKTTSEIWKVMAMAVTIAYKLVLLTLLGGFLVGMLDYFTNHESNKCSMTYMYEIPTYVKIDLPQITQQRFPRYKLYAYGEGHYLAKIRRNKFSGIPVLFIPGNAGSYKQVRSLGTVALRKAEKMNSAFHFDYFSIDYNEELSGLFGSILEEQTEFVSACIQHILGFYKESLKRPHSVVLVGHSMGGVIARAVLTLPSFNSSWVSTILTQAAPHRHPIIGVDFYLVDYYNKVNSLWAANRNTSLAHVTLVSFGGGQRDILVRTELTRISAVNQHEYDLTIASTAVPGAWISIDHLCVVWCKQLVLVIKRAMFEMVDDATKQITENHKHRMEIIKRFFLKSNTGYNKKSLSKENFVLLDDKMVQVDSNLWSYSTDSGKEVKYLKIPSRRMGSLAVLTHNLHDDNWIFSCQFKDANTSSMCSVAEDLSKYATRLPSRQDDSGAFFNFIEGLQPETHIFIKLPPSNNQVKILAKSFENNEQSLILPFSVLNCETVFHLGPSDIYYAISLPDLIYEWQAYAVSITVFGEKCRDDFGVVKFSVPWSLEDVYTALELSKNEISIKLQTPKPSERITSAPQIHLYLNPSCSYKVTAQFSISEFFGQIFRFYVSSIPAFSASILLRTISLQLKHLHTTGTCPNVWQLLTFSTLVDVVIVVLLNDIFSYLTTWNNFCAKIPMPDVFWQGRKVVVIFLAVFLHVTSQSLIAIATEIVAFSALFMGKIVCFVRARCRKPFRENSNAFGDKFIFPVVFSAALITISYTLCGTFALIFAFIFCISKLIVFHANIASNYFDSNTVLSSVASKRNIYISQILLLISVSALTIPSLIVSIRNFLDGYGLQLKRDPSLTTAVLVSLCSVGIWAQDITTNGSFRRSKYLGAFSKLAYFMALLILLYGIQNTYRIPVILCIGFLALSLCSFETKVSKDD